MNHETSDKQKEDEWLMKELNYLFHKREGIWGYRRMTMAMNALPIDKVFYPKRIRRLMQFLGLKSFIRRSRACSTKSTEKYIEENRMNREFSASKPNEKWVTDVTHLTYNNGRKAYLSVVKDLYDGSIIAYHMSQTNDNPLVMKTLEKAIAVLSEGETPLIHSDRGFQYTSKEYRRVTTQAGLQRSMSRVGNCIDNAPVESFFGHYKCERYKLRTYATYEELTNDTEEYIAFYNHERFQEGLNCLAPMVYREQRAA